jgi:uncharacterized membrane protein YkvA (DUF1232 family)
MNRISSLSGWRGRIDRLKSDVRTLYSASRDPRVPWYAKMVAGLTVAYALSPIDLIPDFIPVLGQLDDVIVVPLGLALAVRLIPPAILAEHRARILRAEAASSGGTIQGSNAARAIRRR